MVRAGEAPSCAKCVTLAEGLQDGTETVQQRRCRSRGRTADTPSGEAWGGEGRGEGSAHTYCEPVGGTRVPAGPPTPASSGRPRLQPPCARSLPRSLACTGRSCKAEPTLPRAPTVPHPLPRVGEEAAAAAAAAGGAACQVQPPPLPPSLPARSHSEEVARRMQNL